MRIWLLALVPGHRYGRPIIALIILALGFALFAVAVHLAFRDAPPGRGFRGWPTAAFFVCAIAYIVPVFHYITARTQQALATLLPYIDESQHATLKHSIDHRTLSWALRTALVAIALWIGQSRLLAGSWTAMGDNLSASPVNLIMAVTPLLVWLTMCASMSALFQNALLFRRLAPHLDVRILEPDSFMPVGSMAVTSTLVVVGALGLLSIMWLDGPVNWWTTLPAMAFFSPLLIALLLIPVLPIHQRLTEQRTAAVATAQDAIREAAAARQPAGVGALADALSLRREMSRLPTWPFDVPAITRFAGYAVIVPLTWAGAALIEILVNSIIE